MLKDVSKRIAALATAVNDKIPRIYKYLPVKYN